VRSHVRDAVFATLACGEEARIGAAWSDIQANAFRTFGAVAFVCGFIAIDVNACIDVAAGEMNTDELAAGWGAGVRIARSPLMARYEFSEVVAVA
jgi:hypothetical protein